MDDVIDFGKEAIRQPMIFDFVAARMEKTLLTIGEVCEYTGYTKEYIHLLKHQGKLTGKKYGSRFYFSREGLNAHMAGKEK